MVTNSLINCDRFSCDNLGVITKKLIIPMKSGAFICQFQALIPLVIIKEFRFYNHQVKKVFDAFPVIQ